MLNREFLQRVRTSPVKKANPKMQVDVKVIEEYGTSSIDLKYSTSHEQGWGCIAYTRTYSNAGLFCFDDVYR